MDSLGSMAMPETLLITKAFDQQLRALTNKISIQKLIHNVTETHILIYYANINIFMHRLSVSSGLQGILVLNKTKYPITSEGQCLPDPLLQRFNTEGSPLSKSQICP